MRRVFMRRTTAIAVGLVLLSCVGCGKGTPRGPSPVTGAESKAREIAKHFRDADPTLTVELSMAKAWDSNPALYEEYRRENSNRQEG